MIDVIIRIVEPIGKAVIGAARRYGTVKEVRKPVSANITYYTTGESDDDRSVSG